MKKFLPLLFTGIGLLLCAGNSYGDNIAMKVMYRGIGTRIMSNAIVSSLSTMSSLASSTNAGTAVSADVHNRTLAVTLGGNVTSASITIKNKATGRVVYTENGNSSSALTIDLGGYKAGDYYLDVTFGGTIYEGAFTLR